jgi:hypothetical protein
MMTEYSGPAVVIFVSNIDCMLCIYCHCWFGWLLHESITFLTAAPANSTFMLRMLKQVLAEHHPDLYQQLQALATTQD